jgi:hypothetical protein
MGAITGDEEICGSTKTASAWVERNTPTAGEQVAEGHNPRASAVFCEFSARVRDAIELTLLR